MSGAPDQKDLGPFSGPHEGQSFFRVVGRAGKTWEHTTGKVRLAALLAVSWLPLLVGSWLSGALVSTDLQVSFLGDFEVHIRFLVALPLLLLAGHVAETWLPRLLRQFEARGLIGEEEHERFKEIVAKTYALRNSPAVMPILIVAVYVFGVLLFWRQFVFPEVPTWYASVQQGDPEFAPVGFWFAFVSLPIFQVLLLRWYFHLFLWAKFLWCIARMNLQLVPSHPDRMGGLGFLSEMSNVLAVFAMVHGALLAGWLSTRVLLLGEPLKAFYVEIGAMVIFVSVLVLSPMLAFTLPLRRTRRNGIRHYGELAMALESQFEERWVANANDRRLGGGHSDFRDLANMSKIYAHVETMYRAPITRENVARIAVATLIPVSPLLLTVIPLDEAVARVVSILFEPVSGPSTH